MHPDYRQENACTRTGIFMIDASQDFLKDGNKNCLREQDIHQNRDVFNKQTVLQRYSRMVPVAEIANPANDLQSEHPALHRFQRARRPARSGRTSERRYPRPRY